MIAVIMIPPFSSVRIPIHILILPTYLIAFNVVIYCYGGVMVCRVLYYNILAFVGNMKSALQGAI